MPFRNEVKVDNIKGPTSYSINNNNQYVSRKNPSIYNDEIDYEDNNTGDNGNDYNNFASSLSELINIEEVVAVTGAYINNYYKPRNETKFATGAEEILVKKGPNNAADTEFVLAPNTALHVVGELVSTGWYIVEINGELFYVEHPYLTSESAYDGLTRTEYLEAEGINFVMSDRTPNWTVVDLAFSQVGQKGGEPYWTYVGYNERIAWCASFVYWCMRHDIQSSGMYPEKNPEGQPSVTSCGSMLDWFEKNGRFVKRGLDVDIVAGDVILFDGQAEDGWPDHIGIVIGRDEEYVYVVEGNASDACKVRKYQLDDPTIRGYGIMDEKYLSNH